jgi:hypothetical protein
LHRDERDIDEEAAFVAAMVHDLGLTDSYHGESDFARTGRISPAASWTSADGTWTVSIWSRTRSRRMEMTPRWRIAKLVARLRL